jgi:CHASE2 domain-containing sensor protein
MLEERTIKSANRIKFLLFFGIGLMVVSAFLRSWQALIAGIFISGIAFVLGLLFVIVEVAAEAVKEKKTEAGELLNEVRPEAEELTEELKSIKRQ